MYNIVDQDDNIIDNLERLTLYQAEISLTRCIDMGYDAYIVNCEE